MSNPKKRKFQILPNSLTSEEENATRSVLKRLRNSSDTEKPNPEPAAEIASPNAETAIPVLESGYTGTTGTTGITDTTDTSRQTTRQPVSPVRDFTKTPNSITRVILAQGLFRGKSKQIYDYLWSISRGAIKPARVFRRTHKDMMKGAGIGSRNTVLDGLRHLEMIGLIKIVSSVGVGSGNEYEIFTPDEIGYTGTTGITDTTGITGYTGISQKPVIPVQPETGTTDTTQIIENIDPNDAPKTSLKTNTKIDDEFAPVRDVLRGSSPNNLRLLAENLRIFFDEAKTEKITDRAAFLGEDLRRRRLAAKPERSAPKAKSFEPGAPAGIDSRFEPEALTEEGREIVLKSLRAMPPAERLKYEANYTADDWAWLTAQMEPPAQSKDDGAAG